MNKMSRFFFPIYLFLGFSIVVNGVSISIGENFLLLKVETQSLRYYQARRSSDLKNWTTAGMPYFLGDGKELDIQILPKEFLPSVGNTFFVVADGNSIPQYSNVNGPPILILAYTPFYPAELKQLGIEGEVVLVFVISSQGYVIDPIVESATDDRFSQEALRTIRAWQFIPARKDGEKPTTRVRQPLAFVLQNN
jgi:TonB family protein